MKRRVTLLLPTSLVNALFTLDKQPFARRLVSARVQMTIDALGTATTPLLQISDASGNVLFQSVARSEAVTGSQATVWSSTFADSIIQDAVGGSIAANGVNIAATPIPADLEIPPSGLLTVQLFGSSAGDTVSQLALVTDDDYPLEWPS